MAAWIGREADDVPPGWMDHAITRLFTEWNVQVIKLMDLKNGSNSADCALDRERNARTLERLARSLDLLIKLETARASRRTKMAATHEGALDEFKRRIDRIAQARGTDGAP
jgi:hypothetical protein